MLPPLFLKQSSKGDLIIRNEYWEVIHSVKQGGCIRSIRFFNGSGKNILISPVVSYFAKYKQDGYRDIYEDSPKIVILEDKPEIKKIKISGKLYEAKRKYTIGNYDYIYEYHQAGYIKTIRRYDIKKHTKGISQVGIGCMDLIPVLSEYGVRPSPHNQTAKDYHSQYKDSPIIWGKVLSTGYNPQYIDNFVSYYFCVFNRGVEGIEVFPGSNIDEWERQITEEKGYARFAIFRYPQPDRISLVLEPFFSPNHPRDIYGRYSFTSYIGLPHVKEKLPRKYFSIGINNKPWPSDEDIKKWADKGINLVRLHNDYHYGKGGSFWKDGMYPPYEKEEIKEMERVISTCHKYGVKIIAYFSICTLHPDTPAYKRHHEEWKRTITKEKKELINEFGARMCLQSDFKEYLKSYIKQILSTYKFDGIYFDGDVSYCNNSSHGNDNHYGIEGFIDLLEWSRNFIGENGVLVIHQSLFPLIIAENLADEIVTMEEAKNEPYCYTFPPDIEGFSPHCTFMNIAPRQICTSLWLELKDKNSIKDLLSKCILLNYSVYFSSNVSISSKDKFNEILNFFSTIAPLNLSEYRFMDYTKGIVVTDKDGCKGAVYFKEDSLIIIVSNITARKETFTWKVNLNNLGWDTSSTLLIRETNRENYHLKAGKELTDSGIKETLQGFDYKIYIVKKIERTMKDSKK